MSNENITVFYRMRFLTNAQLNDCLSSTPSGRTPDRPSSTRWPRESFSKSDHRPVAAVLPSGWSMDETKLRLRSRCNPQRFRRFYLLQTQL